MLCRSPCAYALATRRGSLRACDAPGHAFPFRIDGYRPLVKVAFNASQLLSPLTGIGQYTLNLGSALRALNEVDLEFFYDAWSRDLKATPSDALSFSSRWSKRLLSVRMCGAVFSSVFHLGNKRFDRGIRAELSTLSLRGADCHNGARSIVGKVS